MLSSVFSTAISGGQVIEPNNNDIDSIQDFSAEKEAKFDEIQIKLKKE